MNFIDDVLLSDQPEDAITKLAGDEAKLHRTFMKIGALALTVVLALGIANRVRENIVEGNKPSGLTMVVDIQPGQTLSGIIQQEFGTQANWEAIEIDMLPQLKAEKIDPDNLQIGDHISYDIPNKDVQYLPHASDQG